jgi:phosphoglycerate dehydrogenase-like enzyme
VGNLLFPELRAGQVIVTNSAGVMGDPIAEQVLAGVLYFVRNIDVAVDQQRRSEWNKTPFVSDASVVRELSECHAVIVGVGGIGGAVARRLRAFGCRTTGIRRRPELGVPDGFVGVVSSDQLDRTLSDADILVLATPLTDQTRGLLSARRLDCLPPSAIVVNVARGDLVDERALAVRLAADRLRGAVLDVFQQEPLAPTSPLWKLRNVLITPHVAAVSPRMFWERELELFLDNWQRYRAGRALRNHVDKEAGY